MKNAEKPFVGVPTNAELLGRCRQGDQRAWRVLVKRYERLPYAMATREGLDNHQAADVTQHAFAELHKRLDSIREPQALGHWLMTVSRREIWRIRRRMSDVITLPNIIAEEADFADEHAVVTEVYDAVQALGDPCRSLILGLFFDPAEPSYEELASRIGRPVGSVGPLRGRCLERLRTIMEGEPQRAL